ncbi:PEGA domain-containing protein, partial [Candidatus Micrarchaeota archaeon]|nr:PEGA domain-containing protein [Candidatus Micrarchaeota archaeon]
LQGVTSTGSTAPPVFLAVAGVQHDFVLKLDGYPDYSTSYTFNASECKTFEATLQPLPSPSPVPPLPGLIVVISTPGGAAVYLDGNYVGTTSGGSTAPLQFNANVGNHVVKVSLSGYSDYKTGIYVNSGQTQTITASLERQVYGYVFVNSIPAGATVTIDGVSRGVTPNTFSIITPNSHVVQVSLPGFAPWAMQVGVDYGQTVTVNAVLQVSSGGFIRVESTPQGAEVYIDNIYKGHSNVNVGQVTPGFHSIRLHLSGYEDWSNRVYCDGINTALITAALIQENKPTTADVIVTSNPQGASVYVDGAYKGVTSAGNPFDVTNIAAGAHSVTLKLAGYDDYTASITAKAGDIIRVDAVLDKQPQPQTAAVILSSQPSDAQVYLDNVYKGITPVTLSDVAPGTRAIALKLDGYADYSTTVSLKAGDAVSLSATLNALPKQSDGNNALFIAAAAIILAAVIFALKFLKK